MNRYAFAHAAGKEPAREDEAPRKDPGKRTLVDGLVAEAARLGAAPREAGKQGEDPGPGQEVAGERRTEPKLPPDPEGEQQGEAPSPDKPQAKGEQGALQGAPAERGENGGGGPDPGGATPSPGGTSGADAQGGGRAPIAITHLTAKTAADGSADSRSDVGVGEIVTFRASLSGTWSSDDGSLPVTTGNTATWTAPDTGKTVSIIFNDPTGRGIATPMKVHAPSSVTMTPASTQNGIYRDSMAGSGMFCTVTFGPGNVSFGALQMREVPGAATNVTGYFLTDPFYPHPHSAGGPANWHAINDSNVLSVTDDVSSAEYAAPWSEGTFDWVIPNVYYVGPAGAEYDLATTKQSFVMKPDGTVTITKQGATTTRTPPMKTGKKAGGTVNAG